MSKKLIKKILPKPWDTKHTLQNEFANLKNELGAENGANLNKEEQNMLSSLRKDGFVVIPNYIDAETCENYKSEIEKLVEQYKNNIWIDSEGSDHRIYAADKVSEMMAAFFNDEKIRRVLSAYEKVALEKIIGFTLAAKMQFVSANKGSGGGWHRDSAAKKQSKSILYLNDVTEENGPFQYLVGSHKSQRVIRDQVEFSLNYNQNRFNDEEAEKMIEKYPERLKTFTAKAGTLLLVDTRGIHRGQPMKAGKRYALTNYFWFGKPIPKEIQEQFVI